MKAGEAGQRFVDPILKITRLVRGGGIISAFWDTAGLASSALVSFIRDFQTLIAGLIAIAAAYITVRPVWRQLDLMSVETNTTLRGFLLDRIQITERRRKWLTERLEVLSNDLIPPLHELSGGHINSEWAFNQALNTVKILSGIQQLKSSRRDALSIESAIDNVILSLGIAKDTLEAIHQPESMDRSGEHYDISDEDWDAICRESAEAEDYLPEALNSISESAARLDNTFSCELDLLRERVRKVENLLIRS